MHIKQYPGLKAKSKWHDEMAKHNFEDSSAKIG